LTIGSAVRGSGIDDELELDQPENTASPSPELVQVENDAPEFSMDDSEIETELDEVQEIILHVASETVIELLERMGIDAEVTARFGEADDNRSRVPVMIDINGKDLSILIGPQAEILNALQYIANLIVGKELGRSVPLVVDVEGFRERRAQAIRRMARTMADQAIKSGRRQILEPMPANERRLVHIELREDEHVYTESTGEDPRRKVMIIPKDSENA
jgi:spoIIIJ-associated protein